jgi:hypothetical protein
LLDIVKPLVQDKDLCFVLLMSEEAARMGQVELIISP